MDSKQKSKKVNKKYTNRPLVALVIVSIMAVGVMYWLKNSGTKEVTKTGSSSVSDSNPITVEEAAEMSARKEGELLDMNNTTNAKIENGQKVNTSDELKQEKDFQGMEVKDIKLATEDYVSTFTAKVINDSGKDFAGGAVKLVFTNQDGTEYATLDTILPGIKNGGSNEITASTTADIINAYNVTIQ